MNEQDFISSGILEAYVMGAASQAERAEVEAMVLRHPDVKAELEAIEDTMQAYAFKHAVEPPSLLKDKVLNAVRSGKVSSEIKEFRIEPPRGNIFYTAIAIAASVALVISIPLNIYLYSKVSSDESKITAALTHEQDMETAIKDSTLAYKGMRNKLYVLTDPMFKMIPLKGQKISPDAKVMVCWCPTSKELYMEPEKLPAAPKGMQYELWAIVDGKPVEAGMVSMTAGMQKMKLIGNASAFAITLEKEGGSDIPHGDMYVEGAI